MATAKRQRQKAGRQVRLEQARAAQARKKRNRRFIYVGLLVVAIIAILFVAAPDDDDTVDTATSSSTTATTAAGDTSTTATTAATGDTVPITIPPAGASVSGETACPPADGSAERTTTFENEPPTCIDTARTYTAEIVTSEGSFTVELYDDTAPITVNNFVVLARYHYYDGVAFHRIIPGFMDQVGDAVGPTPGAGGPGYMIPDELPADSSAYVAGAVAMANAGPNTGGSQFFVVVGDGGAQLQPNYSLFGQVTAGQDVVDTINTFGTPGQAGSPTREVVIESVTITES